jgi:diadenosine tetraphosphate (Ap4A) HIT family hydrolase
MKSAAHSDFALDPRLAGDSHPLARLALSDLRLMDDSHYPWLVLIPRVAGARDLVDLDHAQRHTLCDEIDRASRLLRDGFRPYKLNVAALGNVVAQLHVHVIARFEDDPAWPSPIWGKVEGRPYSPEALVERTARLEALLGP